MNRLNERSVWQDEALVRNFLISAVEAIIIDKPVGEEHYICVHAILLCELDNRLRVGFRKPAKQRYV